ncbi:MAG: hypothetical protein MR681_05840 [Prevotella sp.]|nr:hypothetical protein [Prevotella sp.]
MKVYIKDRKRRKEEFQFFMHDFVDACKQNGLKSKPDILPNYKFHFRAVMKHVLYYGYLFIHKYIPILFLLKRKYALIIAANGNTIKDIVFPYYGLYEIIPVLWDVWPSSWDRMYENFQVFDIKTVFVTSSQMAKKICSETKVNAYWIPEGLNVDLYIKGDALINRQHDIFEMGRQMPRFHVVLEKMLNKGLIKGLASSNIHPDGTLNDRRVAYTNAELYHLMADSKIMVCFPQCDTNPQRAGNIETLTQRYWEAMLSRCLMIGRAPQELTVLIGYDPVVTVDWEEPEIQLSEILNHIEDYQSLVDHNYQVARQKASWNSRIDKIKNILKKQGYEIC